VERRDAARIVEQMIEGGVDLIQLRGKNKSIERTRDLAASYMN
jgi:thiamine monophosphate synthase